MAKILWDQTGEREFYTGVDKGVFYAIDEKGEYKGGAEAWNGLISVTESPSGAEPTALYANNRKYAVLMSTEEFGGTIEAYTYPDGFEACNGVLKKANGLKVSQQKRKTFGFAYRNTIGNDVDGTGHAYEIHMVYGAMASVSERAHTTINDSPEAETMSWEFSTTPVEMTGCDPTAHISIKSTDVAEDKLKALEDVLFGTDEGEAYLPLPDEVATLLGDGEDAQG